MNITHTEALQEIARQADRDLAQANDQILRQAKRIARTATDIANRLEAGGDAHLVILNDCDGQNIASQAAELAGLLGKRSAARELKIGTAFLTKACDETEAGQ